MSKLTVGSVLLGVVLVPASALAAASFSNDSVFENPGLLPTNPFYFFKTFSRNTQRVFTINPVKKAGLELDILDQKIGELVRLREISVDEEVIKNAIDLYLRSLGNLQTNLQGIKENSKNSATDQLLNKFLEISVKHLVLFQELEKSEDISLRENLEKSGGKLSALAAETLNRLDSAGKLRDRLEAVAEKQNDDLKTISVLDRLNEKLSDDSYAKDAISQLKEKLLLNIQVNFEEPDVLAALSGNLEDWLKNPLPLISAFDGARDRTLNADLKNTLALIRQKLLDAAEDNRLISKPEAEQAMDFANRMIKLVESRTAKVKSQSVNTLLSRAKFNLTQADISFNVGQYADAFGQATASLVSAENAFSQLVYAGKGEGSALDNEIKRLKNDYDRLVSKVAESELTLEVAPKLFALISLLEKTLVKVSDLSSDKTASFDKINAALRDVKLTLARAYGEFDSLSFKLQRATDLKKDARPLIEQVLPASAEKEKELKNEVIQELKNK